MTTEQLAALKELAERATPGPWLSDDLSNAVKTMHGEWIAQLWSKDEADLRNFFANREFIAAFDPATCLELLEEVERIRGERDELSTTIEVCHAMLDKLDPEYEQGMTTLTPLDTRLREFLWPEGRITDDIGKWRRLNNGEYTSETSTGLRRP
jgi:hypothetical protein